MSKEYLPLGMTESQWPYFRHWLMVVILTEGLMLIYNKLLFEIYMVIAVLFLGGFLLRVLHVYPGQREPLFLDFSAVCLAVGFAILGKGLLDSSWRFLLILCSSTILIPHFIYIAREK